MTAPFVTARRSPLIISFPHNPTTQVVELDWWDETSAAGAGITCTPAQHFSGRTPTDRDSTLWGGFVIHASGWRVFYAGDTGWLQSRHSFAATGSYRLEVGIVNWGDEAYDSGLAFDVLGLSAAPVPEPAGWHLLLAAGLLGWLQQRRRAAAAAAR